MAVGTIAVLASLVALPGCFPLAAIGAAGTVAAVVDDRRTHDARSEDGRAEGRAIERLKHLWGDRARVRVTAYNGTVLLTGLAPDAKARDEIERAVISASGAKRVTNEIEVGRVDQDGSTRTGDALLATRVRARFLDAGRFNPTHVAVVTDAGIVYLMGIVTAAEAGDAVEIARTTSGVRKVVKIFEYCRPADEVCRTDAPAPAGR